MAYAKSHRRQIIYNGGSAISHRIRACPAFLPKIVACPDFYFGFAAFVKVL
jgi:hypothetical protein